MFACCAFAVFLLNQLLLPFATIYRRFAGRAEYVSASASWNPGHVTVPVQSRRLMTPVLKTVLVFELLLLGGSIAVAAIVVGGDDRGTAATQDILKHIPFCGDIGHL